MEDGLVPAKDLQYAECSIDAVLILVVVEDGLVLHDNLRYMKRDKSVLILVVVEDGLVLDLIRLF